MYVSVSECEREGREVGRGRRREVERESVCVREKELLMVCMLFHSQIDPERSTRQNNYPVF